MIAHLSGILSIKTTQSAIVTTGGIGYEVLVPLSTFYALPEEHCQVDLHIHTHVREDALLLFGFHTTLEKTIFLMLISVSGIGPKLALNILSGIGPHDLLDAMALGDAARLQTIPGVGRKTAERIALELKDKASKVPGRIEPSPVHTLDEEEKEIADDARSALINLGYSAKNADKAIERAVKSAGANSLETIIREALKLMA